MGAGSGGVCDAAPAGKFTETRAVCTQSDKPVGDLAFLPRRVPAIRCLHREHRACSSSSITARIFVSRDRSAICGRGKALRARKPFGHCIVKLVRKTGGQWLPHRCPALRQDDIGVCTRNRGRFHRDLAPVRAQFLRDDLRQDAGDALPHFQLRDRDGDNPVLANFQPRIKDMLACGRAERVGIAARKPPPRDQQSPTDRSPRDQPAPGDLHRLDSPCVEPAAKLCRDIMERCGDVIIPDGRRFSGIACNARLQR